MLRASHTSSLESAGETVGRSLFVMKTACAAAGSVGARIAPRTNAAPHGRPTTRCATSATAEAVRSTSPTASKVMERRRAQVERREGERFRVQERRQED